MKRAVLTMLSVLVVFSDRSTVSDLQAQERTVDERVYTDAQAKRGLALYDKRCASCHDGGTMGPELWGSDFISKWRNQDADALYKAINETMPQDAPGSLSEVETLSVIAYLLQQSGFPSGSKEMQQRGELVGMRFVEPKP